MRPPQEVIAALRRALAEQVGAGNATGISSGAKRRRTPAVEDANNSRGKRGSPLHRAGLKSVGPLPCEEGAPSKRKPPPQQQEHYQEQQSTQLLEQQRGALEGASKPLKLPSQRRRWNRCMEWSRCAMGCVPCPINPNGRLPPLVPVAAAAAEVHDGARAMVLKADADGCGDGATTVRNDAVAVNVGEVSEYYMGPLEEPLEADEGHVPQMVERRGRGRVVGESNGGVERGRAERKRGKGLMEACQEEEEEGPGAQSFGSLFGALLQKQDEPLHISGAVGITKVCFLL